jgi:phenylacetate-CoA ligase
VKPIALDGFVAESTGLGPAMTLESLRFWQLAELRKTIAHAAGSLFYGRRLAGVDPASIQNYSDLAKLPFTTVADLRNNPEELLAVGSRDVSRVVTLTTSGTTGNSKRVFFTDEDEERTVDFFAAGMSDIAPKAGVTMVLLGSSNPGGVGDLLSRGLAKTGRKALLCGCPGTTAEVLRLLREGDCQCVVGPPVLVNKLAASGAAPSVKAVLLSADYIPGPIVNFIAARWNCEVFAHYGLTESCFGGCVECRAHDGMHIRENDLLLEIIDPSSGRQLPPGETGEIVFSTLRRKGMPLIRFRTGDRGRLLSGRCRCGSALQRLDKVRGRLENEIMLSDGQSVSIHKLDETLFAFDGLLDYDAELNGGVLRLSAELVDQSRLPAFRSFAEKSLPLKCEIRPASFPLFRGSRKRTIKTA